MEHEKIKCVNGNEIENMKLIFQTTEYEEIKKRKQQQYRLLRANILGTTEHEKVKQNKREQRNKSRDMSARIVKFKAEIK